MTGALYDPGAFGAAWARDYDRIYPAGPHAEEAADLVADLADRGPVLELAVGTGRLALPISARGLAVTGLDASRAMLDQLRAKPGAEALTLVEGDMVDTRVPGAFRVVLLAFNSLFVLSDQATQVTCMTNAAAHLDDEGMFMVEAFVPDPAATTAASGWTGAPSGRTRSGWTSPSTIRSRRPSTHACSCCRLPASGCCRSGSATPGPRSWMPWPGWRACAS